MRAALPLPVINMVSILCRVEQAGLRGDVGSAAPRLNRPGGWIAFDRRINWTIAKVKRQESGVARIARVRKSPAFAARHSREAATKRLVRVRQLGEPPERTELLRQSHDPLVHQIAAQPARDEVQVRAGIAGPRPKRPGKSLAEFVQSLGHWRKDSLRLGPAAGRQLQPFPTAFDLARK